MDTPRPTRGRIGRTHHDSTPWYEPTPTAAPESPNVVYVVLDDVGYADLGCYGSEIEDAGDGRARRRRPALLQLPHDDACARRRAPAC